MTEESTIRTDTNREELRRMVVALRTRLQLDQLLNRKIPSISLKKHCGTEEVRILTYEGIRNEADDPSGPSLEDVRQLLGDCRRCSLCTTRTRIVFGEGNAAAELVFVGEAPGADEDRQGRPFVGKAGQLLTRIIDAMGLKRRDVYICNILKCRPPENRNPRPEEIEACEPFLIRQLQAIRPKVICALGTFAARALLKTDVPISVLRGRFQRYQGILLMPTYHPAYLLRNPASKRQVWEDVQQIIKVLCDEK